MQYKTNSYSLDTATHGNIL